MISVRNLTKVYKLKGKGGENNVVALNDVSVDFPDKGLVFLLGKSGSGKSTLLNTIGGLDSFDSGEIIIKGKSSKKFKQSDFDSYRNTFIGFIFQEYNILEEFTVGKNLALALELQGKNPSKQQVNKLLEQVDLQGYYKRKPNQLSGGQKQRVAIARALIKDPEIIMADEPTGALDSNTGRQVMDTLKKLSKDKLVIIVSHDREFAEIYGDRVIELKDGKIISDETKHEVAPTKSASGISYIDDKLVHIKKGQDFSKEDLIQIGKLIVENTTQTDTIISFDEKSNEAIKKASFITDEGNCEVFKPTTSNDIDRKQYDGSNFRMIKSRLRMKDSFKIGASSLKHKPIRLFFTILLSFVAFAAFGLIDAMSQFNRADSLNETIKQTQISNVIVEKRKDINESYDLMPIQQNDIHDLKQNNKDYDFYPVIHAQGRGGSYSSPSLFYYDQNNYRQWYSSSGGTNSSNNPFAYPQISGFMEINQAIKNDLDLEFVAGGLPENEDEVCITENLYETFKDYYKDLENVEELIANKVYLDYSGKYLKIAGIIKNKVDLTKYKNVQNWNKEYKLAQEVYNLISKQALNMCYVSTDTFNTMYSNYSKSNRNIYIHCRDEYDNHYSFQPYSFSSTGPYISEHLIALKSGADINNLKADECLLEENIFKNYFNVTTVEEIKEKLNSGAEINLTTEDGEKMYYKVLSVIPSSYYHSIQQSEYVHTSQHFGSWHNGLIIADEVYNAKYVGYDQLVVKLKDNNSKFLHYCDKLHNGGYYSVQCIATDMLDEYGNLVVAFSKYMMWVAVGIAVFAGLMLMNFISVSITYKKREIGVLRAIGARGKDVFSIFFAESFVVCLINFILATIGCGIACFFINRAFISSGFNITLLIFTIRQVILIFGVSLFVAFISTFFPVRKFAKKNPIDSINNR